MRFAAEMLRHKALGFIWNLPAFGEEVGMWRSQDKKLIKSAQHRGVIGRLIEVTPWQNGTTSLIAKGSDLQDPAAEIGVPSYRALGARSQKRANQNSLQCSDLCPPFPVNTEVSKSAWLSDTPLQFPCVFFYLVSKQDWNCLPLIPHPSHSATFSHLPT